MPYDVFISYSGRDVEWATGLYRRLRRFRLDGRHLRIFFAPAAVSPGESIPRALSEALRASRHLLIVLSRAWLQSEWCRFEDETATWTDPSASRRVVLPLLIEDCQVPPALKRIRHIDFRDPLEYESSLRELVHTLRETASKSTETIARNRERDAILNAPILPWLGFEGPSFDFLWPEMVIDPLVSARKHPGPRRRLSNWVDRYTPVAGSSVALVGEPGAGKTTALRSLLLSEKSTLPERRVFLHSRDLPARTDSLISRSEDSNDMLGVIIDGLDEAGSDRIPEIAASLTRLQEANVGTIIASRSDFFDRQYDILRQGLSNLVEVLELAQWQDNDILEFTLRYSEQINHPGLAERLEAVLSQVRGARNMLGNPMRLTLLLYLMATGANVEKITLAEAYGLYDRFYREWVKQERSRGTGGFAPAIIRAAHTEIAHRLNQYKGEPVSLTTVASEMNIEGVGRLLTDTAFQGLLALETDETDDLSVTGFRHETLGEFLISRDILESFGGTAVHLLSALRVTMTHDVNTFVRSGLNVMSRATVERCFVNLSDIYQSLLPSNLEARPQGAFDPEKSEKLRQQILYYIGRMPLDIFPDILRQAYREEPRPFLRRSAALGAILHGDFAIEREYMALLEEPQEALLNRSVQMVNFGDIHADMNDFVDQGQDWSRTRAAIYERLRGTSVRDIRLRWWDMKTLHSFYESRGYRDVLTDDQRRVLETVMLRDPSSPERSAALTEEYRLLLGDLAAAGLLHQ